MRSMVIPSRENKDDEGSLDAVGRLGRIQVDVGLLGRHGGRSAALDDVLVATIGVGNWMMRLV